MYDDRGELFLAHFATFHSPSIDLEAVETEADFELYCIQGSGLAI
jgi:hypothetical protein